ncbi:MAG: septum formation initiator family protein [Aquificaceae bacterium]|nr:septum formation initiator family protein [Aquificaceae bacterium]
MKRSLEGRRSFPALKPEVIPKALTVLLFFYTCYNFFLSQYSIFRVLELRKAIHHVEAQVKQHRAENSKKQQMLELLREHPEHFKEKFAREYMQMQREDEYILMLKN